MTTAARCRAAPRPGSARPGLGPRVNLTDAQRHETPPPSARTTSFSRAAGRIAATRPPGRTARAANSTHSASRSAISLWASARSRSGDGGCRPASGTAGWSRPDRTQPRPPDRPSMHTPHVAVDDLQPLAPAVLVAPAHGQRRQARLQLHPDAASRPDRARAAGTTAPRCRSRCRESGRSGGGRKPASSTGSRLMRAPRAGWKMRTRPAQKRVRGDVVVGRAPAALTGGRSAAAPRRRGGT